MPELTTADVDSYTSGRLASGDAETGRLLATALAAARKFCGWRVTPPALESFVLDGPGGTGLNLPTMQLVSVASLTEEGVTVDPTTLRFSPLGRLTKKMGGHWSRQDGAISIAIFHGFTVAPDFDQAVLEIVDRLSWVTQNSEESFGGNLTEKRVDDVMLRWPETKPPPLLIDGTLAGQLDPYKLIPAL
jgi:hypothetical protein